MKKTFSLLMTGILLIMALAACGQKSQEDVTDSLRKKLDHLKSYKAEATMKLYAGEKPSTYDVEIWYEKPDHYRIYLKNKKQHLSQMILKNDEGVFVLTPQLNKSYRFQSEWPENGSQWYLYESLVRDILNDPEPSFERADGTYVFTTKTNYKHSDLQKQKISLTQKDLKPVRVKIMDPNEKVVVDMKFNNVKFNTEFDDGAFDLKRNMTSAKLEVPAMAGEQKKETAMTVYYPENLPDKTKLSATRVNTDDGKKYVFEYSGDHPFTLIEEPSQAWTEAVEPATAQGTPVNLGFAIGHMTDHSIEWTYDGTDFFLASKELSKRQMIDLARSVMARQAK
ncbi:MAG TPA: outer membrane lipoprotein carrier protein LolA [Bacillales bacterium]|nr:outer membrane lipoprotein carrier protein LolA [Bacillales bacterium]